jgi:hypothetical protein
MSALTLALFAAAALAWLAALELLHRAEQRHAAQQRHPSALPGRFCPACGSDIDGNDPHDPDCPREEIPQ